VKVEEPPAVETDVEPEYVDEQEIAPTGARTARRRARTQRRRNRIALIVTTALLAAAIPVLGYIGARAILDSRGGRLVETRLEPGERGYEAIVEPTPLALVVHTEAGGLVGLTVLSLTSPDGGGAVLFVPPETYTGESTLAFGYDRLRGAFEVSGIDAVRQATANLLNASFTETFEVDGPQVAALVGPVSPLRFANPDDLRGEDAAGEVVRFDGGPVEVPADQMGLYLSLTRPGESDLNRLVRHQLLWESWLGAVAAAPDPATAVPGEGGRGLGHFIGRLALGTVVYQTLPVTEVEDPASEVNRFDPIAAEIPPLVGRIIPLPTAANPGSRVRVRILDGTGDPAVARSIIEPLVVAGAQVVVIGNAERFTYAETDVRYDNLVPRERAERMQAALGVGTITPTSFGTDAFEVTVVVGADLASPQQGAETTV
jgi:LytR cell envelope-related transcriptional attenuator